MVSRSSWEKAAMIVNKRPAHRPVRVQTFCQATESDPARGELLDDGEHVLGVASEAIQFPDGEHVAFAEMIQTSIEMWSRRGRTAHAVVGVNARRPGVLKRVQLKPGILIGGRNPCVPDDCQLLLPSHYPVAIWVLILPVMRQVFRTVTDGVAPGGGYGGKRALAFLINPSFSRLAERRISCRASQDTFALAGQVKSGATVLYFETAFSSVRAWSIWSYA